MTEAESGQEGVLRSGPSGACNNEASEEGRKHPVRRAVKKSRLRARKVAARNRRRATGISKGRRHVLGAIVFIAGVSVAAGVATACFEWFRDSAYFIGLFAAAIGASVKVCEMLLHKDDAKWRDRASLISAATIILALVALISDGLAP